MSVNKLKVHKIIEYLKLKREIFFNIEDVENPRTILQKFGIYDFLRDEETALIISELSKLAEAEQNRIAGELEFKILEDMANGFGMAGMPEIPESTKEKQRRQHYGFLSNPF